MRPNSNETDWNPHLEAGALSEQRARPRHTDDRHPIESIRAVLVTIACLLLLDSDKNAQRGLALVVSAYASYAGILLWLAARGSRIPQARGVHWLDALSFLLIASLAGKFELHYFLFLLFPVLFAAWRRGVGEGMAVAAFCGLATLATLALRPPPATVSLLLPLSLLIPCPLVAILARAEATAQQGLAFAARLVESIDPRRGFDFIAPQLLEGIAREYDADTAYLTLSSFEGGHYALKWENGKGAARLSDAETGLIATRLGTFPSDLAALLAIRRNNWRVRRVYSLSPHGARNTPLPHEIRSALAALSSLTGASGLMTLPLPCRSVGSMRLILSGGTIGAQPQILDALIHLAEQLAPSLENTFLLERLASEAVDTERACIGRDLHDLALQPYIGLKFGLEALTRRAGPDNPVAADCQHLLKMTCDELAAMRETISGMRGAPGQGGALLSGALQRQAARFGQLFGIEVEVNIEGNLLVSRRIAGDLLSLVAEGLSNIRRHTPSCKAWIALQCQPDFLTLSIRNEHVGARPDGGFVPRSITERVETLDGCTELQIDNACTTLRVRVPLPLRSQAAAW